MNCESRPPRIVFVIWMVVIIVAGATAGIVIGARNGVPTGSLWAIVIWVFLGGVEVTCFLLHDDGGKTDSAAADLLNKTARTPSTSDGSSRDSKQGIGRDG